jgi:hypothetical protein
LYFEKNLRSRLLEEQIAQGDNIKINLKEPGWGGVDWLYLAQERNKRQRSALFWYITLRLVVIFVDVSG